MKYNKILNIILNYFFIALFIFSVSLKVMHFDGFVFKMAKAEVFPPALVDKLPYLDILIEIILIGWLMINKRKVLVSALVLLLLLIYGFFVYYVHQYGNYCGCINLIDFGDNWDYSISFNVFLLLIAVFYLFSSYKIESRDVIFNN